MTAKTHSIAIAEELPLEKWWHARTHTARGNGSILLALRKKIFRKSGIALIVKSREKKLGIPHREDTSSIRMALLHDSN